MAKQKKHIVIILANGRNGKGGIERSTLYLMRSLRNYESELNITEQISMLSSLGVLRHLTTIFFLLQFAIRLLVSRVDLVHINIAPRGSTFRKVVFAALSKWFGKPTIIHLHGGGYKAFYDSCSPFWQGVIVWLFRSANLVIILGEDTRSFVEDQLGVHTRRIAVIRNGVPRPEKVAHPTHDVARLCFMGRLIPSKGVDILLSALGMLKQREVAFRAVIGGTGDIAGLSRIARDRGVDRQTEFLGWLNEHEVMEEYSRADIFVLPSLVENQPMCVLEAMAHGLPVVATRVGEVPQQVIDGTSGLIVAAGDSAELADALEKLCRSPGLRCDMGRAGHARWQELFSVDRAASRLATLYKGDLS